MRLVAPSEPRTSREDTQVVGDAAGKREIGAGGQVESAALRVLLAEKLQQLQVVGEMRNVERDGLP